ncbi:restriction endonuclease subunit S [Aquimarina algiphila]|uniref:restriction endonuclease subunit S n=1 Tax=Aquimarina algiphila TaxID=2047982 RepID=UPI0024934EBE|nr:restriction endonuclease subunit S [Aquimarina algiphila]
MNYKRIGDYIELVDERNKDLQITTLLGLSISKQFIPSVANTIGTNMKNYKIVRKNQFACSVMQVRRDGKMPVALLKEFDEAIISQAYPVFQVIDETELLPEYLMMWFMRSEFDREATFHAVGGVRGSLEWEGFLDFELPIPSIEKQRQIVAEYNTVTNRINLNNQFNQKLEATAQALYKHWFVDFEFPIDLCQSELVEDQKIDYSKGYKSNGGEMVYNEELDKDIPVGWSVEKFDKFIDVVNGFAFKSADFKTKGKHPILKIKNITPPIISLAESQFYNDNITLSLEQKKVFFGDILISMTGSGANQMNSAVGQIGRYYSREVSLLNQRVGKLNIKEKKHTEYVYHFIKDEDTQKELLNGSTGSANQANISPDQIKNLKLIDPNNNVMDKFQELMGAIFKVKRVQNQDVLFRTKDLLLAKMTQQAPKLQTV